MFQHCILETERGKDNKEKNKQRESVLKLLLPLLGRALQLPKAGAMHAAVGLLAVASTHLALMRG